MPLTKPVLLATRFGAETVTTERAAAALAAATTATTARDTALAASVSGSVPMRLTLADAQDAGFTDTLSANDIVAIRQDEGLNNVQTTRVWNGSAYGDPLAVSPPVVITAAQFGADPNLADNSTAIQNAIRAAQAAGIPFEGAGIDVFYPVTSDIELDGTLPFDISRLALQSSHAPSGDAWDRATLKVGPASLPASPELTVAASEGDTSITGDDASALTVGQDLRLIDTVSPGIDLDTTDASEPIIVASVAANVVTLAAPLRFDYAVGSVAQVMAPGGRLQVRGKGLGAGQSQVFVACNAIADIVPDIDGEDFDSHIFRHDLSLRAKGVVKARGARESGAGYGDGSRGGAHCEIDVIGQECRHLYSDGSDTAINGGSPRAASWFNHTPRVHDPAAIGSLYDTHGGCFFNTVGPVTGAMAVGATDSQDAVTLQGTHAVIDMIDIEAVARNGLTFQPQTDYKGECRAEVKGRTRLRGRASAATGIAIVSPTGQTNKHVLVLNTVDVADFDKGLGCDQPDGDVEIWMTSGTFTALTEEAIELRAGANAKITLRVFGDLTLRNDANSTSNPALFANGTTYAQNNAGAVGVEIVIFGDLDAVNANVGSNAREVRVQDAIITVHGEVLGTPRVATISPQSGGESTFRQLDRTFTAVS